MDLETGLWLCRVFFCNLKIQPASRPGGLRKCGREWGTGIWKQTKARRVGRGCGGGCWPGLAAKAVVVIQKLSCVATRCSTLHPLPDCVWPDASFFLRCGRPSVGLCGWLPKEEERLPILVAEETPFPPAFSLPATRARSHARTHASLFYSSSGY